MSDPGSVPRPERIDEVVWEIPVSARDDMRVPARVFSDEQLLEAIMGDDSLAQLQNVATLPGIHEAAIAMPDIHQGYGFPVGGLAAMRAGDGVVSPGGIGYDINCGVRLMVAGVGADELGDRKETLVHELSRRCPAGAGKDAEIELGPAELDRVLVEGPAALLDRDVGSADDVAHTESEGRLGGADPGKVSDRARERGSTQLGTVGSGNHFIEVQRVEQVHEPEAAAAFGLAPGRVTVLIHSGSRGLGHQVCTDYVKRMDRAVAEHGIELADRQLACAPIDSEEGGDYLAAMAAAANFAWSNRAALAHGVRESIRQVLGDEAADATRQVYDVAHNIAKRETYDGVDLLVHRKGATRAFPPGSEEIPEPHRAVGQAVFIPGSMGTRSFVLAGRDGSVGRSFGTVCHGAGRRMSRTRARKQVGGKELRRELEQAGVTVRCPSNRGLAEEAPFAYKEVERVVEIVRRAGLAEPVAELRPIGVVKG